MPTPKVLSDTESSLYDKALYKVAWTHYKLDRFEDAVGRFFQLVDFAEEREKNRSTRLRCSNRSHSIPRHFGN